MAEYTLDISTKKSTSVTASKLGLTPYFYDSNDVEAVKRVICAGNLKVKIADETMHTFWPKADYTPLPKDQCIEDVDAFGFQRFNAMQVIARPSMPNVRSCHALISNSCHNPGGNFNYLANPFWTTFGIYKEGAQMPVNHVTEYCGFVSQDFEGLPNYISTVNALLCMDSAGVPSVMLSRIYGDSRTVGIHRLIRWLSRVLGLRVYMNRNWSTSLAYASYKDAYKVQSSSIGSTTLTSLPAIAQACGVYRNTKNLVARYNDINNAKTLAVNDNLLLLEKHEGIFLEEARRMSQVMSPMKEWAGFSRKCHTLFTESEERVLSRKITVPRVKCPTCGLYMGTMGRLDSYVAGVGMFCTAKCRNSYVSKNKVALALDNNTSGTLLTTPISVMGEATTTSETAPVVVRTRARRIPTRTIGDRVAALDVAQIGDLVNA